MARRSKADGSTAVGISGGTGFASIVMLLSEGSTKSVLLILAPTLTIVISGAWSIAVDLAKQKYADWQIKKQRESAEARYELIKSDPTISAEVKDRAKKTVDALRIVEIEIAEQRVSAIVAN
jgi:hypothetical protein